MTWQAKNSGLTGDALTVYSVSASVPTMSQGRSNLLVYAATLDGLYKSEDGCDAWSQVTLTEPEVGVGAPDVASVIASRIDENTVYVHAYLTAENASWLGKSTDKGSTWSYLNLGGSSSFASDVYSITDYSHVQRRDSAASWTDLNLHTVTGGLEVFYIYWYETAQVLLASVNGAVYQWNGTAWSVFAAMTGQAYGMVERANGNFVICDNGVPSISEYQSDGTYVAAYGTPRGDRTWVGSTYYDVLIAELEGTLYVGQSEYSAGAAQHYLRIYQHVSADTWTLEYEDGPSGGPALGMRALVAYDDDLWYCGYFSGTAPLKRNGGAWTADVFSTPDQVMFLAVVDGSLYAAANNDGIYRRDVGGWTAVADSGGVVNIFAFTYDDTDWFAFQDSGGLPTSYAVYLYNAGWVLEVQHNIIYTSEQRNPLVGVTTTSNILPQDARAHTIDLTSDESGIYICGSDTKTSESLVIKANTDLSSSGRVYIPYMAAFIGVSCDPDTINNVDIFGSMGAIKYMRSTNGGGSFTDKTFSGWMIDETISCALRDLKDPDDIVAFLYTSNQAYRTEDGGDNWTKQSDTNVAPSYGARYMTAERKLYAGDSAAGDPMVERSTDRAESWVTDQPTTSFGVNAITTAVV